MSDARAQVIQALDALVADGLIVAGLAGRDGLPVLMKSKRPVQEETFSAMGAALLASAEAVLQELAEVRPALALVEAGDLRLAVAGIDDSHLLVCVAPASIAADKLRKVVDDARARLKTVLGG
ncbi:MAG: roadblock/LC7 domain-containing protein [Candidatus Thermoplasmatota archaeon]